MKPFVFTIALLVLISALAVESKLSWGGGTCCACYTEFQDVEYKKNCEAQSSEEESGCCSCIEMYPEGPEGCELMEENPYLSGPISRKM